MPRRVWHILQKICPCLRLFLVRLDRYLRAVSRLFATLMVPHWQAFYLPLRMSNFRQFFPDNESDLPSLRSDCTIPGGGQ
jgi:hypothetical protein